MIKKEIRRIELHFDNPQERDDYIRNYEKRGYKILKYGAGEDFYFIAEYELNEECV